MSGRRDRPVLGLLGGLAIGMATGLLAACLTWPAPVPTTAGITQTVTVHSVASLEARLQDNGFTLAAVRRGEAPVPRLFLRRLPDDWRSIEDPRKRKRRFIAAILPLILAVNADIAADRRRLLALADKAPNARSDADRAWLNKLARRYGTSADGIPMLKRRVNVVPPSLALAQAAVESGWGTSRFAMNGNALFGQRIWRVDAGMTPLDVDADTAFRVRSFPSLAASVAAYAHNLNTHRAYSEFRGLRATAGQDGRVPGGNVLATTLIRYSERGADYVADLLRVIRGNRLTQFDSAALAPADAGARISARDNVKTTVKQGT